MKLIMTEEEKQAATWAELDDDALGKVVKSLMFKIKEHGEETQKLFVLSAAIALCSLAAETNAGKFTTTVEGLTSKGQPLGDWRVTIRRIDNQGNKV